MTQHQRHEAIFRRAIGIGVLVSIALSATTLRALAAVHWLENPHMGVQVDGKPAGTARLFDSEDYQRMLLQFTGEPHVYVLDLAASTVYQSPNSGLKDDPNGGLASEEPVTEYLAALENSEGTLSFPAGEKVIALAPLPPIVGKVPLDRVLEVKPAYRVDAAAYKPDPAKIAALKTVTTPTEVRVFFGTWCLICKKLLPGAIRAFEAAANPRIEVAYYGVSEDLAEPAAELGAFSISKTPTILVLQNGREIGRIEEKAETTVEGDLAAILGPKR